MSNPAASPGPLIRTITLRNILSFGPETEPLPLESLNVLIGPNGSGKSNLLDCLGLLRTSPSRDGFRPVIARGGGIAEWIWKGRPDSPASIEVVVSRPEGSPLRHKIAFRKEQQSFVLDDERVEAATASKGKGGAHVYYDYGGGGPVITSHKGNKRELDPSTVTIDQSILGQRSDPEIFPEITYLANVYDRLRLYREWTFGRKTLFREPQKADLRIDRLEEDYSNLGVFLNRLRRRSAAKQSLLSGLADVYEGFTDFELSIEGGTVQVYFTEGEYSIPATRLSDGSLRFLCLLALLCDPAPPPLIAIEEPELGLHPDLIPKVADLLVAASSRTQLIITTHSDILVDALSERPSAVVVCENHAGRSVLRRLDPKPLKTWLAGFRLGQLWIRGDLGGTRW